jgi:hypothetical protein
MSPRTFDQFLKGATANRELWDVIRRRAWVPDELLQRVRRAAGSWHLLVLLEDWRGAPLTIIG